MDVLLDLLLTLHHDARLKDHGNALYLPIDRSRPVARRAPEQEVGGVMKNGAEVKAHKETTAPSEMIANEENPHRTGRHTNAHAHLVLIRETNRNGGNGTPLS